MNETDGGVGADDAGGTNETEDDGLTGGNGNGTDAGDGGDDDIVVDAEGEQFEFVVVEDARDGERADGGSGGLLGSVAPPQAASD